MDRAGIGRPRKNESAWHTILSGNSNMISPAMRLSDRLPESVFVVPSQKISFTGLEFSVGWKQGATALPIPKGEMEIRETIQMGVEVLKI